jgi:3-oxoacyl-[acyl-carrier protein] reductase
VRIALVTGVSRRRGIGFAVATRLLRDGARVFAHSYAAYDSTQAWGADPGGMDELLADLGGLGPHLAHLVTDLAGAGEPERLVRTATERYGPLDTLVINHARSALGRLGELEAEDLDTTWAVNVRASLLLIQEFVAQYQPHKEGGRVIVLVSGQILDAEAGFRR